MRKPLPRKVNLLTLPQRLQPGKVIKAPEFYGCCNTGRRACLGMPKIFAEFASLNPKGFRFAVGPELYLMEAVKRCLFGKATHVMKDEPKCNGSIHYTVKFYKSYGAAKGEFRRLWIEQNAVNKRMAEEANAAAEQAQSSDPNEMMEGILKLSDY